jgi:hypothetical protein
MVPPNRDLQDEIPHTRPEDDRPSARSLGKEHHDAREKGEHGKHLLKL